MKKIKIVAMMSLLTLVFAVLAPTQVANAATCPPHGNYVDRVDGSSNPSFSSHNVPTGYYVNGSPIYQTCLITTVYINHGVYCGKCNAKMSSYSQTVTTHSIHH